MAANSHLYEPAVGMPLPSYLDRRRICEGVTRESEGATVVFTDPARSSHVWGWLEAACPGTRWRYREFRVPGRAGILAECLAERDRDRTSVATPLDGDTGDRLARLVAPGHGGFAPGKGLEDLLVGIETAEAPESVRAVWRRLPAVTVLDPATVTGDWLISVGRLLEATYLACLDRMRAFADDAVHGSRRRQSTFLSDFRAEVARIEERSVHHSALTAVRSRIVRSHLFGYARHWRDASRTRRALLDFAGIADHSLVEVDTNVHAGRRFRARSPRDKETGTRTSIARDILPPALREEMEVLDWAWAGVRAQRDESRAPVSELRAAARELDRRRRRLISLLGRSVEVAGCPDREDEIEFYGFPGQGRFALVRAVDE